MGQPQNSTETNTPATGATFIGWNGACSGTGSCTVTMDAAKTVTATFSLDSLASFAVLVQPVNGLTTGRDGDGISSLPEPNRPPALEPGGAPIGTNLMFLPLVNW